MSNHQVLCVCVSFQFVCWPCPVVPLHLSRRSAPPTTTSFCCSGFLCCVFRLCGLSPPGACSQCDSRVSEGLLVLGAWGCAFGFGVRVFCFASDRRTHNPNFRAQASRGARTSLGLGLASSHSASERSLGRATVWYHTPMFLPYFPTFGPFLAKRSSPFNLL